MYRESPPTTLRRPDGDLPTDLYLSYRHAYLAGAPADAYSPPDLHHLYHGIRTLLLAGLCGTQHALVLAGVRSTRRSACFLQLPHARNDKPCAELFKYACSFTSVWGSDPAFI